MRVLPAGRTAARRVADAWRVFLVRAAWVWPMDRRRGLLEVALVGGAVAVALSFAIPVQLVVALGGPGSERVSGVPDTCPAFGAKAEKGLTKDAVLVLRCVHAQFPSMTAFGGNYAAGSGSDHNTGRAVDSMVPGWQSKAGNNLGWQVAYWEQAHATQFGISYLIFDDHIWSVRRSAEGWRTYKNPYGGNDASARHLNHVHTSVKGDAATITR
jgi:hypothetical protein